MPEVLPDEQLDLLIDYWNAANYLTVGQIYLQDNPLLEEQLRPEHIKPRLLGHWGTSPGLSLVYAHVNQLIRAEDVDAIFIAGPGHGGPAVVANVYLEGTYSEIYPAVSRDAAGLRRLFRQFSSPGGIPSHVSVPIPGSIHEGGELGYALVHAFGAAFDNPDLLVACVVGDGEAETGPLEGSWKSLRFSNPVRDGAVLPILHLNGYKIANPTVLGRAGAGPASRLLEAHGYQPRVVSGHDPHQVHRDFAAALTECWRAIRAIQRDARERGFQGVPPWPAIVLETPKGWTGPKEVDGLPVEGTFRSHQVPIANVRDNPDHLRLLEAWLRSYHPELLFDRHGRLVDRLAALAPAGERRMGANPHANGGRLTVPLELPDYGDYRVPVERPGAERAESTRRLGVLLRDVFAKNAGQRNFRLVCPDELSSNRLDAVLEVENRCWTEPILPTDEHLSPDGRVLEVLSEHLCQGWLEGYLLTGRHGLFATYEAFAMVSASMTVQHAKWLEAAEELDWRAPVPSLNFLLSSTCWRNDHNGFSHQGPGLVSTVLSLRGTVTRIYLPPDANCLLSVADHCLRSRDYVNLIVIDKQPQLQYLDMDAAREHCARGASVWEWASTDAHEDPDVVLACVGDIPTLETLAAAALLREFLPHLRVRVVNLVDLMTLPHPDEHPHGMAPADFARLFTVDTDVVMAFHGYQNAVHQLLHGRPNPSRFHVRGFHEQGTTTTPFDMVVLNGMDRYSLAEQAVRRSRRAPEGARRLLDHCRAQLERHHRYKVEHLEDMPEVRDWRWPGR
jgi:xylulose-5-phosphate/fructose-6-phosphate phosphoketolase